MISVCLWAKAPFGHGISLNRRAGTTKNAFRGVFCNKNMEFNIDYLKMRKNKAYEIFTAHKTIYNPYFQREIILNSDGFYHLQFSGRKERNINEQILKFNLLPLGLEIIKKSGTIQEYRRLLTPIGKPSSINGSVPMKEVEYWGLVAIVGENQIKIRTILRRIGDGNITFWSVMPYSKIRKGNQKIFTEGIEDD